MNWWSPMGNEYWFKTLLLIAQRNSNILPVITPSLKRGMLRQHG